MKNKRWIAASLMTFVVVLIFNLNPISAQTNVALCDVGLIFKSHPVFSSELAQLKQQADQFRQETTQLEQQLMQKAEVLRQYEVGSVEFNNAETKLAQEKASMEVQQRDKMRKLMQQEAELHFQTYEQVKQVISTYCQEQGIQLVLRYNSEQEQATSPQEIMQLVNGSVIYHQNRKDITSNIIQRIAQASGTANRGQRTQR